MAVSYAAQTISEYLCLVMPVLESLVTSVQVYLACLVVPTNQLKRVLKSTVASDTLEHPPATQLPRVQVSEPTQTVVFLVSVSKSTGIGASISGSLGVNDGRSWREHQSILALETQLVLASRCPASTVLMVMSMLYLRPVCNGSSETTKCNYDNIPLQNASSDCCL